MHRALYNATLEGQIEVVRQSQDGLERKVTPYNNTVLHVAAQSRDDPEFVKQLLNLSPSLLFRVNNKGDTALHIAARKGHCEAVTSLVEFAQVLGREDPECKSGVSKEMLKMANKREETALFNAVRNKHVEVVKLLMKEDPELLKAASACKESPLYLAAERNYCEILTEILKAPTTPYYIGPGGKTALHAAVIQNCEGCVEKLLQHFPTLIREGDSYGWTPLHYAAFHGYDSRVEQLLKKDSSIAYLTAEEDELKTALHLSASKGHVSAMKQILSHCPDCWEMEDGKGQNILHMAVNNEKEDVIEFITEKPWLGDLINEQDVDGNTPLHLLATSDCYPFAPVIEVIRTADKYAFNKKNNTPLDTSFENIYRFREVTI